MTDTPSPTTRKVVWAADISLGSSPHETACYAVECGSQFFGTATSFWVDGQFVDCAGDEPSANRPCYNDILLVTRDQLATLLVEWNRRSIEEAWPERTDPDGFVDAADLLISLANDPAILQRENA